MLCNNNENMIISIVIPVYNVEKYIDVFMSCLEKQTVQNFVAIFVNDMSPDKSINLIGEHKRFFGERLVIIDNEKNMGLSKARNIGLDYVSNHPTKYVTFLDPDDWVEPDYLEDLYSVAELNNLDLCIGGIVRFRESDSKTICIEMTKMGEDLYEESMECDDLAYINPCAYAKLFKYDPIKEIRFREIKRSEDTCYLFEALKYIRRIKFTNRAKYHYCVRNSSLTGNINYSQYESMHTEFAGLLSSFEGREQESLKSKFIAQIFIRSSIGGVCRLSFGDLKKTRKLEKQEYKYLEEFIPQWRCNKYINFGKKSGVKEIALSMCALTYKMHVFFIVVWLYYIVTAITGKDFRA